MIASLSFTLQMGLVISVLWLIGIGLHTFFARRESKRLQRLARREREQRQGLINQARFTP